MEVAKCWFGMRWYSTEGGRYSRCRPRLQTTGKLMRRPENLGSAGGSVITVTNKQMDINRTKGRVYCM